MNTCITKAVKTDTNTCIILNLSVVFLLSLVHGSYSTKKRLCKY